MKFLLPLLCIFSLFGEGSLTTHLLELESGPLPYTAFAGSLPVKDGEGEEKGQIAYIAYIQESPGSNRPITFAFNGGPGSSSVWLHLGTFGPRRIVSPEEGQSVEPPYQIVDNHETILDLTDIVFIDPIGTGFAKSLNLEDAKPFFSVSGDVESIGDFIRDYLTENGRWNSPLYLAGESYGTSRASGLSNYLQSEHGIYLNGLILISCALDFQTFVFSQDNILPHLLYFPTYVATAWHHGKYRPEATLEEVVSDAKKFAYQTYLPYLLAPRYSSSEREDLFADLANMTNLPYNLIKKENGKIVDFHFFTEFFQGEKKTLGRFDTRCTGDYSHPSYIGFAQDPSASSIMGIFSTGFHSYLHKELNYPSNYKIFCIDANRHWKFDNVAKWGGYPNFMDDLRAALVTNPSLKLFIGSGYFDGATPFAATEYSIDHLDLPESYREKIQMEYYEGGHMYYLNPTARKKFKNDLIRFFQENK